LHSNFCMQYYLEYSLSILNKIKKNLYVRAKFLRFYLMISFVKFLHSRKYFNTQLRAYVTRKLHGILHRNLSRDWSRSRNRWYVKPSKRAVAKHVTLTKFWQVCRKQDTSSTHSNIVDVSFAALHHTRSTGGSTKSQKAPFRRGHVRARGSPFFGFKTAQGRVDIDLSNCSRCHGTNCRGSHYKANIPRWQWPETSLQTGKAKRGWKHTLGSAGRAHALVSRYLGHAARWRDARFIRLGRDDMMRSRWFGSVAACELALLYPSRSANRFRHVCVSHCKKRNVSVRIWKRIANK